MDFEIIDYEKNMDRQLLDLFYQSIFYKRKEFEYARSTPSWFYRYSLSDEPIIKIGTVDGKIIASLGLLRREGIAGEKKAKIGCFVDNCILPKYLDKYEEFFFELFKEIEEEAREKGIDVIQGWEFIKHVKNHETLWKNLGFKWVEGVNWYPGGSDINGTYPQYIKNNLSIWWKILVGLSKYLYKFKERSVQELPEGIGLRVMEENDCESVSALLNRQSEDKEFAPDYTPGEFEKIVRRNNIHGIIAERDSKIVGVLTYITSAWSGWMYGKPYYDKDWTMFYSFTPDEFVVRKEYQNTSVPTNMVLRLIKTKDPEKNIRNEDNYTLTVDVFDRRCKWRKDAFLNLGFTEPKFDHGAILAKSLNKNIKLDPTKIWHLPARYVLAPVPSTQQLQRLSQQK
jgi:hypothetical protein